MSRLHVLGINGSLRGAAGTSAAALDRALGVVERQGHDARRIDLATWGAEPAQTVDAMVDAVTAADAVLVATGTYWSGPSSLVQRWLEVLTFTEGGAAWRGTAAGVIVTMHSVGGLETAQRLAGTLVLLGATIPAAGTIVLADGAAAAPDADTWVPDDLEPLVANVLTLAALRPALQRLRHWPVDAYPPLHGAWPSTGALWTNP